MRTFTLIDNDGNTYDVTARNDLFFYGVEGLGYAQTTEFQRIEDRYALLSNYTSQSKIKGTIKFWQPDAERKYFDFAQFCQNGPIRMKYNPGHGEFYRNGVISEIVRTDGTGSELRVTLTFMAQTPWYKSVSAHNDGQIVGGKVYPYTFDYTYSSAVVNSVSVESDSYQSSPVKLIIYGPATNPSWRHYLNNVLQTSGRITGSVLANHKLIIDTTSIPYSIKQFDMLGNEVSDMYQLSDFSTDRFIRFGKGRNTVSVQADNTNTLNVGVEAQIEYATV